VCVIVCVYECVCLCTCVRMCVSVCGLLSGAGAVHRAWMARRLRAARGYTGTQGSLGNLLMCLYICMAQRNQSPMAAPESEGPAVRRGRPMAPGHNQVLARTRTQHS